LAEHRGFQDGQRDGDCRAELALRALAAGTRRFSDLQRALDGISQKVLTDHLRDLQGDGVLARTIHPEVPPRVDHSLTTLGRDLLPVLDGLHASGEQASRSVADSSSA